MKAVSGCGDGSRKFRNICLAATAVVLVAAIILVIICSTVFKPKKPKTTVDSAVLRNLEVQFNIPQVIVDVNLTLVVDLSVKNPNKVSFKYKDGTAFLNYRGTVVGQAHFGAGGILAEQTEPMNVTLTIMADRLLGKSELLSDVVAGTLPLNTLKKINHRFGDF